MNNFKESEETQPMYKRYGYVRVSSTDQNEDRQVLAMRNKGITWAHLYIDKQSG